ncbi:MAG: SpoIIE family protein phosphatase [Nitriliruptorales bacterium]|nr:SpoIIE family protein phosphatase [Nitriliruptorales bacterium]
MQHLQTLSSGPRDFPAEVLGRLPFPLLVVDASRGGWEILDLNRAARTLAGEQAIGRPLTSALPLQVRGVTTSQPIDAFLKTVTEAGAGVAGRRVELDLGEIGRATMWLSVSPMDGDGGVRALVLTLVDDAGEGFAGQRRRRRDVLRTMATDLVTDRPLKKILQAAAEESAQTAGATRAAIMLSDGSDEFWVAAAAGEGELPARFPVPETAESLVDVAWGRRRLVWSAANPDEGGTAAAAIPFLNMPGWEQALVVGMRVRGGGFGLLAVGDPADGEWDDGALERLDLAGVLVGAAFEGTQLRSEFARLEELLQGAVRTSANLVGHTEPAEVRRRLVECIVSEMGLAGAALWLPDNDVTRGSVLAASCGLPDAVRDRVALLPRNDAVTTAAAGQRRWHIPSDATSARAWAGHHLHLVPVPEPSTGALGVYSSDPLPGAAAEVFASLGQALASAVHQTTLHRQARSVVESLQRQLQPRGVELAPGLETGHIYRSATAGVPIGGDFLDIFATATGHIGLACGDVSGKGIEAATLSAMAVYSLRAFALQGAMPRIVTALMDSAVEAQTGDDRFLTMIYARIEAREWSVELTTAGHPPPILVGPSGAAVLEVPADVPVGMLGTSGYRQKAFSLPEGHSLVLYTDGVTEARSGNDGDRSLLGLDRLVDVVDDLRDADAQGIADGVWKAVQEWTGGITTDDCAVVVVRRIP